MSGVGNRLGEIRRAKGMTHDELARAVGIDTAQLQRIETGFEPPRLNLAVAIATVLDVPVQTIFVAAAPLVARLRRQSAACSALMRTRSWRRPSRTPASTWTS